MTSPDLWTNAWATAWSHWALEQARQGWHPLAMAGALLVVAMLALAVARAHGRAWRCSAVILGALAFNTTLGLDQFVVQLARALAQAGGWYDTRRDLQALVLLGLALAGLAAFVGPAAQRSHRAEAPALRPWGAVPARASSPDVLLGLGMALVVAVTALRGVSLHNTDQWLALRWAGFTLGRLVEGLGLALLAGRAGWLLRRNAG